MKGQVPVWAVAGMIASFVIFAAAFSVLYGTASDVRESMERDRRIETIRQIFYYSSMFENLSRIYDIGFDARIRISGNVVMVGDSYFVFPKEIGKLTVASDFIPIAKNRTDFWFGANAPMRKGVSVFWDDSGYLGYLDELGVDYVEMWVPGNITDLRLLQQNARKVLESGRNIGVVVYGDNLSSLPEIVQRLFFARYIAFNDTEPHDVNNSLMVVDHEYPDGMFRCVDASTIDYADFSVPTSFCMFYGRSGLVHGGSPTGNFEKWKNAGGGARNLPSRQVAQRGKCWKVVEKAIEYLDCPYSYNVPVSYVTPDRCKSPDFVGLTCAKFVWNVLYYSLGPDSTGYGNGRDICYRYPVSRLFRDVSMLRPGDLFSAEYVKKDMTYTEFGHAGIYVGRGWVADRIPSKKFCYMKYIPDPDGDYVFIHSFGSRDYQKHGVCFATYSEMFAEKKTPGKLLLRTFCRPKKCE